MKEILYIQAGFLANYTGTHFWNTQESYFTNGENDEPLTLNDVSFREGTNSQGEPTICPRLLVFDRKGNFGTLSNSDVPFETGGIAPADGPPLWSGDVREYRQDVIPKRRYQNLDESEDFHDVDNEETYDTEIRYWSDFNSVTYAPRTLQQTPDPADWENVDGDWNLGQQSFIRYNQDIGLMEGPVRLFLEECDSPQGIQVMNDTASFGSFVNSFLMSFYDEYLKLPSLVFPLLSDAVPRHIKVDDIRGTKKAVNDAQYLRSLSELSSMSIPIQSPSIWPISTWSSHLNLDLNSMYHTSAVLSAHIESSTLPLRLKGTHNDLASFAAQLNWRGTTPFGHLSGVFPVTSPTDLDGMMLELSASRLHKNASQFARQDVLRGFSQTGVFAYDRWSSRLSLQNPFLVSIHAPAYPLPRSFPSFFKSHSTTSSRRTSILTPVRSTPMFSSIATSSQIADLFFDYATFIENCVKRKSTAALTVGLDMDEMKDLVNDLWTLHDNHWNGGRQGIDDAYALGEDEAAVSFTSG